MPCPTLNSKERKALEHLATGSKDAQQLRRAQALLWLDQGDTVPEVADRLRLSRQVIYKWVAQFHSRQALEIAQRVAPSARSGRPRTAHGIIAPRIVAVIERDPRDLGYRSTVWTAPLLTQYLWDVVVSGYLDEFPPNGSFFLFGDREYGSYLYAVYPRCCTRSKPSWQHTAV